MRDPCKNFWWVMTYSWDNVDIAVAVERDGVDEQDRQGREIVLAKPFGAGYGEFSWYAILLQC